MDGQGDRRWRYMVISEGQASDWVGFKLTSCPFPFGRQRGTLAGTFLIGALCSSDEWRTLKMGITIHAEYEGGEHPSDPRVPAPPSHVQAGFDLEGL